VHDVTAIISDPQARSGLRERLAPLQAASITSRSARGPRGGKRSCA